MADALAEGTEKDMAAGLLPLQVPLLSPPIPHLAPQPPVPSQEVARRIHRAWWARFTFNGITRYERGAYGLVGSEEVGCLLTQKPAASGTGGRHRTPISGSVKYRVLTRARGRCECCGAGCC
jgi:hypothetical protein